jgi:mRNA interferase MazF
VTRDVAIPHLSQVLVAPITRTIRNIPTEIRLGERHGLRVDCVASFDSLVPIACVFLTDQVGRLGLEEMGEICRALASMAISRKDQQRKRLQLDAVTAWGSRRQVVDIMGSDLPRSIARERVLRFLDGFTIAWVGGGSGNQLCGRRGHCCHGCGWCRSGPGTAVAINENGGSSRTQSTAMVANRIAGGSGDCLGDAIRRGSVSAEERAARHARNALAGGGRVA